ncbi:HAD family hydrolase [Sediminibacterium soli]|uniref:HAD family hydrolase n=1 Tax=Sediminibacterium soli TaxID=2698829 RepID=UPI00137B26DB|nr:HAD family hydrolase [Sediminibacterium soli]NCI46287.1 HAD hydrolase-like protein [Sediminibacterium soli]
MRTDLVVFDIAGTTVKDSGNITNVMKQAFTGEDIDIPETEIDKVMGYRKIEAVNILLRQHGLTDEQQIAEIAHRVHEQFNNDMIAFYERQEDLVPLPFAEELFAWLYETNRKVALDTGFPRSITNAILKKLNWLTHPHIQAVVCSDEVPEGRPHPFMIRSVMEQFGIQDAANVVKVGDTMVDILEGRNAGCGMVIGVTTGAYTREELSLYKPDHIIDTLEQVPALLS